MDLFCVPKPERVMEHERFLPVALKPTEVIVGLTSPFLSISSH
jgi:hypothetical protein